MDKSLLYKAKNFNSIEYINIYPNHIFYNSKIQYMINGKLYIITPNKENSIYINDLNLTNVFEKFTSNDEYTHLFLIIDEKISLYNVLKLVENVSIKLGRIEKSINSNK